MILDPETGHQMLFIEVPDAKAVKNRIHFDLRPRAGTRDEEVERLLRASARPRSPTTAASYGPGTGWVVLADPEGNEFCILRSQAEVDAAGWRLEQRSGVPASHARPGSARRPA